MLLTILLSNVFLLLNRKEVVLDEVSLKEFEDNSEGLFAIMIENDSGEYVEYTDSSFPTSMVFNSSLSGCIDSDGNTIDNALSYSSGTATVSTTMTSYCYLYFDIFSCEEGSSFSSCLVSSAEVDSTLILHEAGCDNYCAEDGKYRYSGASDEVNNYVCFGTNDLDTCLADTDTYLFRIIEVDPNTGNVKLIKSTALAGSSDYSSYSGSGDTYYWNSTDGTSATAVKYGSYYNYWAVDDTLYATLATDLNTTYLNTFDTNWQNIIETYNWNVGTDSICIGTPYDYWSSSCYAIGSYTSESSTTEAFKIGLMNAYDYGYAAPSNFWHISLYYYNTDTYATTTSGSVTNENGATKDYDWLYLGSYEWSIARLSSETYVVCAVESSGSIVDYIPAPLTSYIVRPSFYLTSNVTYLSGSGTSSSPYLLSWT